MTKYALYVDDCGASRPGFRDHFNVFALGGVVVKASDEKAIKKAVDKFKHKWKIPEEVPLRGSDIRGRAKKFAWLGLLSEERQQDFDASLEQMLTSIPIIAHACVVHRRRYFQLFHEQYKGEVWSMRKSATSMLLERAVKFVRAQGGTHLDVYFENTGNEEDSTFKDEYQNFRERGHPFNSNTASKYRPLNASEVSAILGPRPVRLSKQSKLLQVADLCVYPLALARTSPTNITNALIAASKVIDAHVDDVSVEGVKYYCF